MIPAITDDQIIELANIYSNDPLNSKKDLDAYLRDAAYYGCGYLCLRRLTISHEDARASFTSASNVDGYYDPIPLGMDPDDTIINLANRWQIRYRTIGRLQKQSNQDNARDLIYWEIFYYRQRDSGYDDESSLRLMENGMADEAHLPLPYPPDPIPAPPSRDEILGINLTFQGLKFWHSQYGLMPGFEACFPWLSEVDRNSYIQAKKSTGRDTHALITLPDGLPLYDEPNQPYSPDRFGSIDWTRGNVSITPEFTDLIKFILPSFNKILLFLGGDGPTAYEVAFKQLQLLKDNQEYSTKLYKYCVVIPGWDSVFYGWPLDKVVLFGTVFRQLFPDGYLGLEHNTGHIPLGEGGSDFQPGGRLQDYDVILSEYDYDLHQDSCWQINGRLVKDFKKPSDMPSTDDPSPPYYLRTPSPRGPFYHCAFEFGEYEYIRSSDVDKVNSNRLYQQSMGVKFSG